MATKDELARKLLAEVFAFWKSPSCEVRERWFSASTDERSDAYEVEQALSERVAALDSQMWRSDGEVTAFVDAAKAYVRRMKFLQTDGDIGHGFSLSHQECERRERENFVAFEAALAKAASTDDAFKIEMLNSYKEKDGMRLAFLVEAWKRCMDVDTLAVMLYEASGASYRNNVGRHLLGLAHE